MCSFIPNNIKLNTDLVLSLDEPANTSANAPINKFDKYEISDVQWFSYSECLEHIRDYNHEKKRLLSNINETLNKYEIV